MQVLVIYCHPVAESFAAAAHAVVLQALAADGHDVTDVDLYAENFDPVMRRQERLDYQNTERNIRPVRNYDEQLAKAEAIVLVYPAWWYGMPAMLKGYFDRVWLPGVAFDVTPDGRVLTERLQRSRRIVVVTTYGGSWWMVRIALGDPARKLVSRAIRALWNVSTTLIHPGLEFKLGSGHMAPPFVGHAGSGLPAGTIACADPG